MQDKGASAVNGLSWAPGGDGKGKAGKAERSAQTTKTVRYGEP